MKYVSVEEFNKDMDEEKEERGDCENMANKNNKDEETEKIEFRKENDNMNQEERCIEEENDNSIFNSFSENEDEYRTYKVYIVREGDSLEQILLKYQINKEELEKYNDLTDFNIGDKIIIPYLYENN